SAGGVVKVIEDENLNRALEHVARIRDDGDDALVRESWDGDTDLRLIALAPAGDGDFNVRGYAQVAPDGSMNANPAQGGRRISLDDGIQRLGADKADMRALAVRVSQELGFPASSMDIRR